MANGGTLFLDEPPNLPKDVQLRVIQKKKKEYKELAAQRNMDVDGISIKKFPEREREREREREKEKGKLQRRFV